jgi:hypothetical protein
MQQVLAAAETNFEMNGADIRFEQAAQFGWRCGRQIEPVSAEAAFQCRRLLRTDGLAAPATEKCFGRTAWPVFPIHVFRIYGRRG